MGQKLIDNGDEVAYLELAGWEYDGDRWIDPESKKPVTEQRTTFKQRNGHVHEVVQVVKPPVRWGFDLEQALSVQRARDNDASGNASRVAASS